MKIRGPIFISVAAVAFLVAAFFPKSVNTEEKEGVVMRTVLSFFQQLHYNPKKIDDNFSNTLFDFYLDRIDGSRRYLTQEQLDQLEQYRNQLDDQAKAGNFSFFNTSLEMLDAGFDKAETYYAEILDKPFDFSKKEYFEVDSEKRPFAKNDTELRENWRKALKYEVMTRVARRVEQQAEKGEEAERKTPETIEEEVRAEVQEAYEKYFKRVDKIKRSNRLSTYLNSIANIMDPHSRYFEPIAKENFDIAFRGTYEGIGARLMLDGDYTKVSEVIAGGPVWKSKEIRENDIFLKVAQGDSEEWQDLTGWILDDVVQLIRGKKGTQVRLMIKNSEGETKEVTLIRDKIKTEETFAKSLILDTPGKEERIGYIFLPSFYTNFEDPNGRSCAKDIAKEIEKLKAENVDGIVLDIRNNGGGSLPDVIKMSGLFIEKGAIVQVKSRVRDAEVYRDVDSRVQYDGPLAVMTNVFSASASEILAAALQDYGRAVVIGSKSTFGKGSVQRFYDMDRVIRGMEDLKPLGSIKLTTQKFYRVNGGSNQLRGVVPDIILPDNYNNIDIGERQEDYPLSWTEIEGVEFDQSVMVLKSNDIQKLRKKSEARVENNQTFQMILENAERLANNREQSLYPLNMEEYQALSAQRKAEAEKFKNLGKDLESLSANNLKADYNYINENEKNMQLNEDFVESVSKDVYIKETLNVMQDLIKMKKG